MARRLEALPSLANIDLDKRLFNEVYYPYLLTINNYEIYYGGNGSGKSSFVGQKLALQMTVYEDRNLVCIRKQKADCVKSCWGEIYTSLKRFHLLKYWDIRKNPEHIMINRINGNHILFEGLDNIEDIKSIKFAQENNDDDSDRGSNVTDIWYEETNAEDNEENVEELDSRVRDPYVKGRMILSFNPVSRTHWLFRYVTINMKLDGVDSLILKTTYKDNRFLPANQGEKLERYKFTNPYRYQVYCLGNWGTMGQTVFDANQVHERLNQLAKHFQDNPYTEGQFEYEVDERGIPNSDSFKFLETSQGKTRIYTPPDPRVPYVVSADTKGEGKDFYVAYVMDNITKNMVASFRFDGDPDWCVWQIYGLCRHYNDALFGPEINFGAWIIKAFQTLGYSNFYRREKPADSTHVRKEDKYGFLTTSGNRRTMLTEFVQWSRYNMHVIYDVELLSEMLTFTVQEKKINGIFWGAEPGAHDDCVMAYAILLQICSQQDCEMQPEIRKIEGYWTKGELNLALMENRVDEYAVREYMLENENRFQKEMRGASRYAR